MGPFTCFVLLSTLLCLSSAEHYRTIPQHFQGYQNKLAYPNQLNKPQKRDTNLGFYYNQLKANPFAFEERKVTTLNHKPQIHLPFKIGKPIYAAPSTIQLNNKFGLTKDLYKLIPSNFNIKPFTDNVLQQGSNYNFDLSAFKTSSDLLGVPNKANDIHIPKIYKPSELSFNSNQYKLDLPKHFPVTTPNLIKTFEKPIHETSHVPLKFDTFVPGVSDAHNVGKGEEYIGNGKEPNSHVKVTNGKVTYEYKIRHFLNKH